jgi:hypothetical protein
MNREELLEIWAPAGGIWSPWARPVLFAQMSDTWPEQPFGQPWLTFDASWTPEPAENVAAIVDLPGAESVQFGLALAGRGYRPVPLFNACTGPHEVIDQSPLIDILRAGARFLAGLNLAEAPPAFLLDSRRTIPIPVRPRDFDNRWTVFPEDFPSPAFLTGRGYRRVLLIQRRRLEPVDDLADVLREWQGAGINLEAMDSANLAAPVSIRVKSKPWYRATWHWVLAKLGLRHSPPGGFGRIVPDPRHG